MFQFDDDPVAPPANWPVKLAGAEALRQIGSDFTGPNA
jgi:hypothetical protein